MNTSGNPPSNPPPTNGPAFTRREFVIRAARLCGISALVASLGEKWAGGAYAQEAPELSKVRVGFIALTDCAPLVVAHEKGWFRKHGIEVTLCKGASWAAIRDSLSNGDLHATHMLFGMPIASTIGLLGSPQKPMIIPWVLNRNGQSISLAVSFKGKVRADPNELRPFILEARNKGKPLTFAMTFPSGTHAMWLRYWLGAGGIHPDRDIGLITIPPPQMVANMKVGKMEGFCVGEPWNARAIAEGIGFTAINSQDIWRDHPEKVLACTEEFAERYPRTLIALLRAICEASLWLDERPENRRQAVGWLTQAAYVNCSPELILSRFLGHYDFGDGRYQEDPYYMIFFKRGCNYPQRKYAVWFLSQYRRWGMLPDPPDYQAIASKVVRPEFYGAALKSLGLPIAQENKDPERLFDGHVFDPRDPEAYALSFPIRTLRGAT
ncbi:CmpA/NrtA family ABC transporter substrate-binding protein [Candidatus Methylacidithermus pantelleriae]|uniref:Nitrate ABC transporter, substrate-binding protein n=1 Tax=Candidatus Methylacidithermus pantelleriae TaxID=2744239 RepID=A0A8J2BNE4_9BACT|nr:CmpA/NrtA family ABC transporter substrate-binding protein [Candidatus Methylacidithermus pantelleriae]CAF0695969.1 Nitrate ABC transporter, substrate-binding protein [Candidatus Methylacidithermus pantelleriae]